jgi:hypothetical protein
MLNKKKAMALASLQTLDDVEYLDLSYSNTDAAIQRFKTNRKINWSKDFTIRGVSCLTTSHRAVIFGAYGSTLSMNIEWDGYKLRAYLTASSTYSVLDVKLANFPSSSPIQFEFSWNSTTGGYTFKGQTLDGATSDIKTGTTSGTIRSGLSNNVFLIGADYQRITSPNSYFDGTTRVYKLEYIEDGVVLNKWKPRVKNNVPMLYDEITGDYLTNQGPGYCEYGRKIREVEYLGFTGTQRFNTLFKPNTLSTTLKATFELIGSDSLSRFPLGVRKVSGYTDSCALYIAPAVSVAPNGYLRLDWAVQNGTDRYKFKSTTERITLEVTGNYANVNGEEFTSTSVTSFDHPSPFYIGNCYTETSGAFQSAFKGKYYFVQLLNTTTRELYRDFIPAIDENGVAFLFDKVSHTVFLPEAGTITEYGRRIIPVEYLYGGTDSQISTMIPYENNTFVIDAKIQSSSSRVLIGAYAGTGGYIEKNTKDCWSTYSTNAATTTTVDATVRNVVTTTRTYDSVNDETTVTLTVSGETKSRTTSGHSWSGSIFQLYPSAPTFSNFTGYLWNYGTKVYSNSNNELLQDLIPARDENAVGFMFDRVTHTIYDNAGTGKFKFGGLV